MKTPILRALIPLMAGILLAEAFPFLPPHIALTGGAILLTLWIAHEIFRRKPTPHSHDLLLQVILTTVFVCVGYALTIASCPQQFLPAASQDSFASGDNQLIAFRLTETPSKSARSVKATARIERIKTQDGWCKVRSLPHSGKVLLFLPADTPIEQLSYGSNILACCKLQTPNESSNPHQFDYRRYLRHHGIVYQCFLANGTFRILDTQSKGFLAQMSHLRGSIIHIIQNAPLTDSQRGIAEALLLGYDNDLSTDTQDQFRNAGITHLLCVSGLHVGIVAALIGGCLGFLRGKPRNRIVKGCIQFTGIWFFVVVTGMAPGTLRAGVMFSFIIVGRMAYTRPPSLNALASSALVLLLCNPLLLFDVGFQLSYSAVAGILLFAPPLRSLVRWPEDRVSWAAVPIWLGQKIWDLACISTAAQLAVTPFLLHYFHQFAPYFLIANITIVPFAGLLLGSVIVMVLVAWWPWLFSVVGRLLAWELTVTDSITRWVSHLPESLIENIYFDIPMTLLSVAFLLAMAMAMNGKGRFHKAGVIGIMTIPILFGGLVTTIVWTHRHQHEMVVYATRTTAVEFIDGRKSMLLIGDVPGETLPYDIEYASRDNLVYHGIQHRDIVYWDTCSHFLHHGNVALLLIDRQNCQSLSDMVRSDRPVRFPQRLDYILLSETPWLGPTQLCELFDFDTLVIAKNNSRRFRAQWRRECDSLQIPHHDLAESGALVVEN